MMRAPSDADLYVVGVDSLLASTEEEARRSVGAAVVRSPGVAAAVFPTEPARGVWNNALLDRDLDRGARSRALDAMRAAYDAAGVDRFAAWVHESDVSMREDLEARGYRFSESTRAMGMTLDEIRLPRPELDLVVLSGAEYEQRFLIPGLLDGADYSPFQLLVARLDGEIAATALAYDFRGDRGIYNVTTLEHARRRGLGTALTALLVHDALDLGYRTASLQSTPMAEGVYAAVGFRDLGRILEFVP